MITKKLSCRTAIATLCSLFLSGHTFGAPPRQMTYAYDGTPGKSTEVAVRRSLQEGWRLFDQFCGWRMGPATFTLAPTIKQAHVRIILATDVGHVAQAWMGPKLGAGFIEVYWIQFGWYSPTNQARTIAHELMHLSLHLKDQYSQPLVADVTDGCPMSDFHKHGWSGRLCPDCQSKTDAIFAKLESKPAIKVSINFVYKP